jgi:diguanylate cyclase (GGDEF)-like protein
MERLASHDPLTRLVNRRRMMQRMAEEQQRTERGAASFVLVMADIDHFKRINDEQGHECGDAVLIEIARRLRAGVRQHDLVARWGGEEFLLLLPDTGVSAAQVVTERLRQLIAEPAFSECGLSLPITMTFGVAGYEPGADLGDAISRADAALYEGKAKGRNRVAVYEAGAGADG